MLDFERGKIEDLIFGISIDFCITFEHDKSFLYIDFFHANNIQYFHTQISYFNDLLE